MVESGFQPGSPASKPSFSTHKLCCLLLASSCPPLVLNSVSTIISRDLPLRPGNGVPVPVQSLFSSRAPPHGTRSLEPSLCPFVDHIPRPIGPKWLPASMWASFLGPPLGGGSSFQRAHPMPDGWSRGSCVAQSQSLGCRLGCPWGGEVGEPCTLLFQPHR